MGEMVLQALQEAASNFVNATAALAPRVVITLSIVFVGWALAALLRRLTRAALTRIGFGRLCERQGITAMLRSAELPPPEGFVAAIVFWVIWIGFLLSGIDVLGFPALEGIVHDFALFVPRLMVGLAILGVGVALANVAWRATLLAAVNAKLPSPRVLSGTVHALVLILAAAMALDHIAVAQTIVLTAFAIAFGAIMLGLAIAFGVGGGGVARRILDHWFPEREPRRDDDVRHL
jgi:hypothetical protein